MRPVLKLAALFAASLFALPATAADRFDSEQAAQQHCPSDTVVWLNLSSRVVHAKGAKWYGKTRVGAYACKKELLIKGGRAVADAPPEMTVDQPAGQPGWRKIEEDEGRTVYVASMPAARDGQTVTMLSLVDLRAASRLSDGRAFLSWEAQYRFDCGKRLSRMEAASMYAGGMGEGEVVGSVVYDDAEWKPVSDGSNGELLWQAACGGK